MSSLDLVGPGPVDTGRGSLPLPRALGAAAWAALLLFAGLAAASLTAAGQPLGGLLVAIASVTAFTVLPRHLRLALRHRPAARAAADGATTLHRATLAGQLAAFSAIAVAAVTDLLGATADANSAATTLTDLAGAAALLLIASAGLVLLPGALFLPERPLRAARWAWAPVLVAAVAACWPGAPGLFFGLHAWAASAPLGLAVVALLGVIGALSALGMGLALVLLPRPFAALDVSADGAHALVARNGGAWLVELATGRRRLRFADGVRTARFAPDGERFALDTDDGEVIVRRTADGAVLRRLIGAPREVHALAFSPDGRALAAVGDPAWVAVWSLDAEASAEARRRPSTLPYGRSLAYTADGRAVVVANLAAAGVRVAVAATGDEAQPIARPAAEGSIARAVLHPTGRAIAFASGAAPTWNRVAAAQIQGGHQIALWSHGLDESVRVLAFGPTGEHLVAASLKSDLRVFGRTGELLDARDDVGGTVAALGTDAGGRVVVVGGRWALRRWDRATGTIAIIAGTGEATTAPAPASPALPAR